MRRPLPYCHGRGRGFCRHVAAVGTVPASCAVTSLPPLPGGPLCALPTTASAVPVATGVIFRVGLDSPTATGRRRPCPRAPSDMRGAEARRRRRRHPGGQWLCHCRRHHHLSRMWRCQFPTLSSRVGAGQWRGGCACSQVGPPPRAAAGVMSPLSAAHYLFCASGVGAGPRRVSVPDGASPRGALFPLEGPGWVTCWWTAICHCTLCALRERGGMAAALAFASPTPCGPVGAFFSYLGRRCAAPFSPSAGGGGASRKQLGTFLRETGCLPPPDPQLAPAGAFALLPLKISWYMSPEPKSNIQTPKKTQNAAPLRLHPAPPGRYRHWRA